MAHLPQVLKMTDLGAEPPKTFAGQFQIPPRNYRNDEFGVMARATQRSPQSPIAYRWGADCLPGRVFHNFSEMRQAYNALPGNEQPAHVFAEPGAQQ